MALGRADRAFYDWKIGRAWRHDIFRPREQNRNVEMVPQEICRLDRALIAAVNEDDPFAFEPDK